MNRHGQRALLMALCLLGTLASALAGAGNQDIVTAARAQVGVTLRYDPAYRQLRYPGGDVPIERGVCTDVIVRALRSARSMDLQKLLHEDMKAHFAAYPNQRRWRLDKPDPNIDHRRVPNLMTWFRRAGLAVKPSREPANYLPGDIVAWDLGRGILHIGIITDEKAATGAPLVVHNIGAGAREEDILFRYTIIGQYRLAPFLTPARP